MKWFILLTGCLCVTGEAAEKYADVSVCDGLAIIAFKNFAHTQIILETLHGGNTLNSAETDKEIIKLARSIHSLYDETCKSFKEK